MELQNKYTTAAMRTLEMAAEAAAAEGSESVGTEYLLMGLTAVPEGTASVVLREYDVTQESVSALVKDLYAGGISDRSALATWRFILVAMTGIGFVWSAILAGCLTAMCRNRPGQGLLALSTAGEWTLHGLRASGVLILLYLIYRIVRYVIASLNINEWAYLLYAMLVSEALMIFLAAMLFAFLCRFCNSLADTAASLARAVTGGTMGSGIIHWMTPSGFVLLGILNLVMAMDRLFTVTIDQKARRYVLLIADHPLLILSGILFVCATATCGLLAAYLFTKKRRFERLLFQKSRRLGKF
jgi:hypothetical protein